MGAPVLCSTSGCEEAPVLAFEVECGGGGRSGECADAAAALRVELARLEQVTAVARTQFEAMEQELLTRYDRSEGRVRPSDDELAMLSDLGAALETAEQAMRKPQAELEARELPGHRHPIYACDMHVPAELRPAGEGE